jgi:hypothetical protein
MVGYFEIDAGQRRELDAPGCSLVPAVQAEGLTRQ